MNLLKEIQKIDERIKNTDYMDLSVIPLFKRRKVYVHMLPKNTEVPPRPLPKNYAEHLNESQR